MTEPADSEVLSPEVQDVMRTLVSAIRTVKLYPSNNPVYFQAVKKAYEALNQFLETMPEYHAGVQKTGFTYRHIPVGKEAQLNRAIAQDLFTKGLREIVFSAGVTETELLEFCQTLALSSEELAIKSGITSLLWEKGATHIKVTESGLDEVILTRPERAGGKADTGTPSRSLAPSTAKQAITFAGRTLVLGDLMADPAGFGAGMVELARQTKAADETMEDRLYALYQEAGSKIQEEHPEDSDTLFEGLAKSSLSLESPYREGLISGKLYGNLNAELVNDREAGFEDQAPDAVTEILTGRFSDTWNAEQIATLLKKSAVKKIAPPSPQPSPDALEVTPIPPDTVAIAREMGEYTPEEMEVLKALGEAGMESDILEASVRTLIFLMTLAKSPARSAPDEQEAGRFSGVVSQLENILAYLLSKKEYHLAAMISRAFHAPVDPPFKPRMAEAVRKTSARNILVSMIEDMRKSRKDSPEYRSIYAYLSTVEREVTEVMLELLADEADRAARIFIIDLVKDLGKNHILMIGDRLSDKRWYFVRNIVVILGESKTEQALAFLRKAAEHKDVRIRQEVVKGLIYIGGKRAAGVMMKLLRDTDPDIQLMAIRGLADLNGVGAEEAKAFAELLADRPLKKRSRNLRSS